MSKRLRQMETYIFCRHARKDFGLVHPKPYTPYEAYKTLNLVNTRASPWYLQVSKIKSMGP